MIRPVRESRGFLEVEKSKFYSYLIPWPHFYSRLEELKRLHRHGSHFVTGYRYFENGVLREGGSNDREPAGTGKRPILQLLESRGIFEVGVVVVRYFGGVLLGRGGLARAYREATLRGIERGEFTRYYFPVVEEVEIFFQFIPQFEEKLAKIPPESLLQLEREYTIFGIRYRLQGEKRVLIETLQQIPPNWRVGKEE
ncbi:MAG: YigZ family protein [Campylobacterales bacterium]